jgi:hypothetical protein
VWEQHKAEESSTGTRSPAARKERLALPLTKGLQAMPQKLKLPRKRVEELLQRLEEDDTMTPEEHELIREIFEDAIRISLMKVEE